MYVFLLILGNIWTAVTVTGADTGLNLLCTNDGENTMSCNFNAQNCSEYRMTLINNEATERCRFSPCHRGCCCSIDMTIILGENFTANVLKGNQSVETKQISITGSIKPKTPSIISVTEFKGNFIIKWNTTTESKSILEYLKAEVTYWKKGTNETKTETVTADINTNPSFYEIRGQNLEPSTTYLVSLKTYITLSGIFSDSSNEGNFTTSVSPFSLHMVIISTLSIAAVIISCVIFVCYVKLKTKWWDRPVKDQKPKLLDIQPKTPEILTLVLPVIDLVSVEPTMDAGKTGSKESLTYSSGGSPKSSGISTGSSSSSYANTEPVDVINSVRAHLMKKLPTFGPVSPGATNPLREPDKGSSLLSSSYNPFVRADVSSSGSSSFCNKTYSIVLPNMAQQVSTGEIQIEAEILCDSAYQPSETDASTCPAQPLINLSPVFSPAMTTDMSYQQNYNADSGGFSYAEDSNQSSLSSGSESECNDFNELSNSVKENITGEEVTRCDENPCYGGVPQVIHSAPPVDYEYQAFQSVVEQPNIVIPERRNSGNAPDESKPILPEIMTHTQSTVGQPECDRPFLPFISADQSTPLFVDSGYQSV